LQSQEAEAAARVTAVLLVVRVEVWLTVSDVELGDLRAGVALCTSAIMPM
jgi:hypothetical protein